MLKGKIQDLINQRNSPSVTISLITHKTHPQNLSDRISLKNLISTAKSRLAKEYDDRAISSLLNNLDELEAEFDHNYNNSGLYIFVSNDVKEYVRTSWPPAEDAVNIDDQFALRDLIKSYNRTAYYFILALSKGEIHLYKAQNDKIEKEVSNSDFPFQEDDHIVTDQDEASNAQRVDNKLKEYFNRADKALVKVVNERKLPVVVVSDRPNYDKLLEIADQPSIYSGGISVENSEDLHQLAAESWKFMEIKLSEERGKAIEEVKQAVSSGKVITDLQEIWKAAKNGQGDLLLINSEFKQAVKISGEDFEYAEDAEAVGVTDDITNDIAWDVISKQGRVYFTSQPELTDLGEIALKVRY